MYAQCELHMHAWVCVPCIRNNTGPSDQTLQVETTWTPSTCGPWPLTPKGASVQWKAMGVVGLVTHTQVLPRWKVVCVHGQIPTASDHLPAPAPARPSRARPRVLAVTLTATTKLFSWRPPEGAGAHSPWGSHLPEVKVQILPEVQKALHYCPSPTPPSPPPSLPFAHSSAATGASLLGLRDTQRRPALAYTVLPPGTCLVSAPSSSVGSHNGTQWVEEADPHCHPLKSPHPSPPAFPPQLPPPPTLSRSPQPIREMPQGWASQAVRVPAVPPGPGAVPSTQKAPDRCLLDKQTQSGLCSLPAPPPSTPGRCPGYHPQAIGEAGGRQDSLSGRAALEPRILRRSRMLNESV